VPPQSVGGGDKVEVTQNTANDGSGGDGGDEAKDAGLTRGTTRHKERGYFATLEQSEALVEDVRAFFRSVR